MSVYLLRPSSHSKTLPRKPDSPEEIKIKRPPRKGKIGKKEKKPLDPANYERDLQRSHSSYKFSWQNLHNYYLRVGGGYARRDFNDPAHHEYLGALSAGMNFFLGRKKDHVIRAGLGYEFGFNHHPIIKGIVSSKAKVHRFGLELGYLYEINRWIQIGGFLRWGMSAYRSPKGDLQGTLFNGKENFAQLRTLNDIGKHISGGLEACTGNRVGCVQVEGGSDTGIRYATEGVRTRAIGVRFLFDVLRIFYWDTPKTVEKKYRKIRN